MQGILDRFLAQTKDKFHPQTIQDYFALHLALKLGDGPAARHYRQLLDQHSEEQLLAAYRKVMVAKTKPADPGRAFHVALNSSGAGNSNGDYRYRLLAVNVERRSVAAAFFVGTQLDYTQNHNLPANIEKAEASTIGFINRMCSHLKVECAVLQELDENCDNHRVSLSATVHAELSRRSLPIWMVDQNDLLASFGYPCPKSQREVRAAVTAIWPVLGPNQGILDAVALGLYVQTERLFSGHN